MECTYGSGGMENIMVIQLIDRNKEMCEAWKKYFSDCEDVEIFRGDLFDFETDCVVSPTNSFGFMNGGVDLAILKTLGYDVQDKLQAIIEGKKYDGELLVGQAEIIPTSHEEINYVICAPTMRVPMILKESANVYLASKAVFSLLKLRSEWLKFQLVESISMTGFGTGVGQVPYDICARQMRKAYDDVWLGKYEVPQTWLETQVRHQELYSDDYRDLQMEE
jgi:O-acetyl-ADP-ribose deacetylase (regulator of RNase III)